MTFVNIWLALAGLAAVAVPIIIHLLSRRQRRPIEWAAMRFLLEAFRRHRRRLRIEQLLLLALRCLILAVLGAALARPMLEAAGLIDLGGSRAVVFILDNGLTSRAADEEGETAFRRHVDRAAAIVRSLDAGDVVGLITAARPAAPRLIPPSSDRKAVLDMLRALEASEAPSDLPGALSVLRAALPILEEDADQTVVYLLSEFRAGSAALDEGLPSLGLGEQSRVTLLAAPPASASVTHVQIESIDPIRNLVLPGAADGSGQVTVRLARTGGELGREVSRVQLTGEGVAPLETRVVEWAPGQDRAEVDFLLRFAAVGDQVIGLTASIDDDRLDADNRRHVVLDLRSRVRVLLVDRRSFSYDVRVDELTAGQWMTRALAPTETGPMEVVVIEPAVLADADLRTSDVAILPRPDLLPGDGWAALGRFVDDDGLLLIAPPAEVNVHQWTEHLADDLGLDWQIARETVEHPDGLLLADEQPATPMLRMLSSELTELTRPIITFRALPPVAGQSDVRGLIDFADGTPLVIASGGLPGATPERDAASAPASMRGMVVYLAVAPELSWTNLPSKPLMLPLMQEIVRQGLGQIRAAQRPMVGDRPLLAVRRTAIDLVDADGRHVALDSAARPVEPIARAGMYAVRDAAAQTVGLVAVNVDPQAGRTEVQGTAAVQAWLDKAGPWTMFDPGDAAAALRRVKSGSPLAGLLLWTLIALVLVETVLARWFSHAIRRGARAGGRAVEFGAGRAAGGAAT